MNYDVFNGDADGIISLLQLRLHTPVDATLVTGVKRDINLVKQVDVAAASSVTVLDISMEKNIAAVEQLLNNNVPVFYADHHRSGNIPESSLLNANIDLDANTCTALIIDNLLDGAYHLWAIAAAYGDNLIAKADTLSRSASLSTEQSELLKELGTLVNYNGYGSNISDLHFHPADLYRELIKYPNPFDMIQDEKSAFNQLRQAYVEDMAQAQAIAARYTGEYLEVFELPDEPWARRISGVYGNMLANLSPSKAHAVLTQNADKSYTVSLRAPLLNKVGAGDVCSQFDTGGGRAAAAGINSLSSTDIERFINMTEDFYS
ncbi:DHH family phosphoesterase [Shewanella youngdeokensis]|uniref:DHH family phosphoesterase n=1 Tax=Shewanella youngdeokensis TaxID=2999068 RepID=A0ABZ0K3I0_9GAMM|nr:DHH family phosphoesterase [Shewanella sp. DAU334]